MDKLLSLKIPGPDGGYKINPPGGIPQGGSDATGSISNIIQWGVTAILVISVILALLFLIYGGIRWISSGGDKAAVEGARKILTYAIIGLAIVFLSFFILNFVTGIFGVRYTPTP